MPFLTDQEIKYLLGRHDNNKLTKTIPTVTVQLLEILEKLLPMRFTGYVILLILFSVMPVLGFESMLNLIGAKWSFLVCLSTSIAGMVLIARNAHAFVHKTLENFRCGNSVPLEVLQSGVLSLGGVLLLLPGALVNFVALGLVFPYTSRIITLSIHRYITQKQRGK